MHEVELQDEDFELYAGFAVRKQYNGVEVTTDEHHQTYLVGTPIQSSIKLPFSAWILNIKDERKYPPTTDRERLSEGAEKQLLEKVRAKLREALSFLQTPGTGAPPSSKYKEILRQYSKLGLEDYLSPETRDYCDFLNIQVRHPGSKEKATISDLLEGPTELFYLSTLNPRKMAAIRREVPTAAFFRFATRSEVDEFSLALRHGVRVADDFIRETRAEAPRRRRRIRRRQQASGDPPGWRGLVQLGQVQVYDKEVQANRPERGRPEDDTHPQGADAWIPRHTLTTRD